MNNENIIPATSRKVKMSTLPYINRSIEKRIGKTINYYKRQGPAEIKQRLKELDMEWDTERVLGANFAGIVLISSVLSLKKSKKWSLLSGVASIFMIQHTIQGWCPPLSFIRRMNVRTVSEINEEREGLLKLLEEQN